MEGEVGPQVAAPPPIFFHQPLPGQFHDPKKRGFPWQFHHPQPQQQQQQRAPPSNNSSNPTGNWNPKLWDWDSSSFAAKPSSDVSDALCLGTLPADAEQRKKAAAVAAAAGEDSSSSKASPFRNDPEVGGENNLTLKLGGGAYLAAPQAGTTAAAAASASAAEEAAIRPSKRVRSGSPGSGGATRCARWMIAGRICQRQGLPQEAQGV
uniref:Uncharacterized protein n=1 Tax=Ananas comosus var. bracteatus TaxID=296719 RepID=A0A6V7QX44_ANACO